ncbi:predicted protein [Histoplasma capsulatum H143]|uniref:Uncharacterized protein n=1 Tax=Ajellomyces capsulatus (strain H143) TaxID=544712 RepID=C6HSL7_AJECH|nr:predicted protein [Histoplasma capsulatum H143]
MLLTYISQSPVYAYRPQIYWAWLNRTICDIYIDKLYDPDLQQAGKMCLLNQGNLLTLVAEWLVRPPGSTLAWGTKVAHQDHLDKRHLHQCVFFHFSPDDQTSPG